MAKSKYVIVISKHVITIIKHVMVVTKYVNAQQNVCYNHIKNVKSL